MDRRAGGSILDRRLVFVTGKGGVGKTTVASALAQRAALSGRRTLLCEMDAKGAVAELFDAAPLSFEPRVVAPNLSAMAMNTEDSLREYLRLFVRIPLMGAIGGLARTFDFVADAAPGVKEILGVGKLCYEVRANNYDLVVVDAEASGHIIAQVAAPEVVQSLVQVGLIRDQTDWMVTLLHDPLVTGLVVVTTPEEMAVTETIELLDRVARETSVDVGQIVVNRVARSPFADPTSAAIAASEQFGEIIAEVLGRGSETVLEASQVLESQVARQRRQIERLHSNLSERRVDGGPPIEHLEIAEIAATISGRRRVAAIAEALSAASAAATDDRSTSAATVGRIR